MNEKVTSAIDYGYDALNLDEFPNNMYFCEWRKPIGYSRGSFFLMLMLPTLLV